MSAPKDPCPTTGCFMERGHPGFHCSAELAEAIEALPIPDPWPAMPEQIDYAQVVPVVLKRCPYCPTLTPEGRTCDTCKLEPSRDHE